MRRHDTHTSDVSAGPRTHSRGLPASLQARAGNRAVASLLAPRSVQRSPAGLPQDRDYWGMKGPKRLDSGFGHPGYDVGHPDTGFTPPRTSGDGLDLGYGGTGDAGFQTDVHNDGGAHSGGFGPPIPPQGLPVPGRSDSDWFDGASGTVSGAISAATSGVASESPFNPYASPFNPYD